MCKNNYINVYNSPHHDNQYVTLDENKLNIGIKSSPILNCINERGVVAPLPNNALSCCSFVTKI